MEPVPEQETLSLMEARADYLTENELRGVTAKSDLFNKIHRLLVVRGARLIAGPRGSGKTHLMRYTWVECKNNIKLPLCIYVSFNRYLRLEPFLKKNPSAIELFHVWVLSRIGLALYELILELESDEKEAKRLLSRFLSIDEDKLRSAIDCLERGKETDVDFSNKISISKVTEAIDTTAYYYSRKRSVVLFDDAALTLTPEYMQELFEVFRTIKSVSISPKASVYPGTTEYGPRFHVNHEADIQSVWLSVEDENYSSIMGEIAKNRSTEEVESISEEVIEYIKYASFGIPRAFLMMLHDFKKGEFRTVQQGLLQIIQKHNKWRISEYQSLALKVPKFQTIISVGKLLLDKIVLALRKANQDASSHNYKQITYGISGIERALEKRMISLLVEAGILYEFANSVSHGEDRNYQRFIPHISILLEGKVFFPGDRTTSLKKIIDLLNRRSRKHAVRSNLKSLIGKEVINSLKIDLPACSNCDTPRISDTQKFCHNCGQKLVDESTFDRCMKLELDAISSLTTWQKVRIRDELDIGTIGEFLALQDPGSELRKIHRIGNVKATNIIGNIEEYVDEFLS